MKVSPARDSVPPHPGPLPQGEGELHPAFGEKDATHFSRATSAFSLSPGERAGVRGNVGPAFLIAMLLLGWAGQTLAAQPNVLLIISDDQGYGDLSLHGNPHVRTPNLDRLATNGLQFERFFVSAVCAPTRASLLTGRYSL